MKNIKRFLALFLLAGLPSMSSAMGKYVTKQEILEEQQRLREEIEENARLERELYKEGRKAAYQKLQDIGSGIYNKSIEIGGVVLDELNKAAIQHDLNEEVELDELSAEMGEAVKPAYGLISDEKKREEAAKALKKFSTNVLDRHVPTEEEYIKQDKLSDQQAYLDDLLEEKKKDEANEIDRQIRQQIDRERISGLFDPATDFERYLELERLYLEELNRIKDEQAALERIKDEQEALQKKQEARKADIAQITPKDAIEDEIIKIAEEEKAKRAQFEMNLKRAEFEMRLYKKAEELGLNLGQLNAFLLEIQKIDDFQGLEKVDELLDSQTLLRSSKVDELFDSEKLLRSSWFNPNRSWSDFGRHSSQALSNKLNGARNWTYENLLKPGYNLMPAPIKKMYDGYNNYDELSWEQQREFDSAIRVLQALSLFGGSAALGRAHALAVQAEREAYAKAHPFKYIPELDKYRKD